MNFERIEEDFHSEFERRAFNVNFETRIEEAHGGGEGGGGILRWRVKS